MLWPAKRTGGADTVAANGTHEGAMRRPRTEGRCPQKPVCAATRVAKLARNAAARGYALPSWLM